VNTSINLLRFWTKLKLELQHAFEALFMCYRGSPTILHRYKSKVFENGHKRETLIQRTSKEHSRLDCLERKGKTKYKQYKNGQGSKMFDPVPNEPMSPDTRIVNGQAVQTIP
jgi:hypothetical protein